MSSALNNDFSNMFISNLNTQTEGQENSTSLSKTPTDLALQQFELMIRNFDIGQQGLLISKKGKVPTYTSSETLLKIISRALLGNEDYECFSLTETGPKEFVGRVVKGNVELLRMGEVISDKTTFADIYSVICFNTGSELAFKNVKKKIDNELESDHPAMQKIRRNYILEEFTWIQKINSKTRYGIITAIKFIAEKSLQYYGYLMERYEENYNKLIESEFSSNKKITFKDRVEDFHQLLFLLKHIHENHLVHQDLKDFNTLVKNVDGFRLVHICDWTSCQNEEDINNFKFHTIYHSNFGSNIEYYNALDCERNGKGKEAISIKKGIDVFAMGYTLYKALQGHSPYHSDAQGYPIFTYGDWLQIPGEVAPTEISTLILNMIDGNPVYRPSAEEAFKTYDAFIQIHYPESYKKLQKMMEFFKPIKALTET